MSRRAVALIDVYDDIRNELQELLDRDDIDIDAFPGSKVDSRTLSHVGLFLIGQTGGDPSRTIGIIRRLHEAQPRAPVFLLAWASSERLAIAALKEGVADYFAPPIELGEVAAAVRRTGVRRADSVDKQPPSGRAIIGDSHPMRELRCYLRNVAQRDCNTLILGETGTGKDLIAEAIHANSPRHKKPFVCVNCAAIPDTLLESELFGYERGAFTGANGSAEGKIGQAHTGTIFFDEIGEMTPYAQAKILKVVEGKQIQRLGGKASVPVDVRIVAATNQDLSKFVSQQRFRQDLYFRLNVTRIQLPPLRERRDDIPLLLQHYVGVFNRQTDSFVEGFTQQAMDRLVDYDWPGNVRELKNMLEAIFVAPPHPRIDVCHLPRIKSNSQPEAGDADEEDQLRAALSATRWNKSKAAEKLHWSRMKIYRKLAKYQIADYEGSLQPDEA